MEMTNIIEFPTFNRQFLYKIECAVLEDGSVWTRLIQMWDDKALEWIKLEDWE